MRHNTQHQSRDGLLFLLSCHYKCFHNFHERSQFKLYFRDIDKVNNLKGKYLRKVHTKS